MSEAESYFAGAVAKDFCRTFVGNMIGSGIGREVFACPLRDDLVVKVETESQSFQNIMEWETWGRVQFTEHAKWFAPCESISPCGTVLLQRRTIPAAKYPEKIPAFLTDTKRSNYGILGKHFVCHDYGYHLLMERGMTKRMCKAQWWD